MIMKAITNILIITVFLSGVISLYSCRDKKEEIVSPDPVVEIPNNGSTKDSIKVYETKQPFILIEDKAFEAILIITDIDKDNQINGKVALEDIENIDTLNISRDYIFKRHLKKLLEIIDERYPNANFIDGHQIVAKNLKGIENFKKLKYLDCTFNLLDSLDLSKNTTLTHLIYNQTSLKYLNISKCKNLKVLDLGPGLVSLSFATPLKKIDISKNPELEELRLSAMVEEIDFSKNTKLKAIDVRFCYVLKNLDLSNLTNLSSFLAINCEKMNNVCLSEKSISKIDTTTVEYINGHPRFIWAKDYWTFWGKCN